MQLVINTRGSLLRRRGDRIEIRFEDKGHEFSAKKVHSIVVATGVRITSDLFVLAADHNIDVVFLDSNGSPTSRVWQTKMGSTANIRRRQLESSLGGAGSSIAIEWVGRKLQNQADFLAELKSRRPKSVASIESAIEKITAAQNKIKKLDSVRGDSGPEPLGPVSAFRTEDDQDALRNSIMGHEGSAGRTYFGTISNLLPADYQFSSRSRRPATDSFNAMLNYSYGVLYSQIERALILAGLDPFIGFLHVDNYNKRSLVYDMIEPFRIIAERTTVLFFTGRRVKSDFFRPVPGGIELAPPGRAALIESLNKRLDSTVRYPSQRSGISKPGPTKTRNIKLRETIRFEAHSLANRLLGKSDIPKLVKTEDLFRE